MVEGERWGHAEGVTRRRRRVPVVTTLTRPEEERLRLHRYLAIMGVALGCFVASPWLPVPLAAVAILVAAVCLPVAAIFANQPRRRPGPGIPVQDARSTHPERADPEHRVIDPDR
jgi:hypothetical protein